MGFYAPAQIVRDAREHGVEVRPVCINQSYWDNVMESDGRGGLALRLGFRQIKAMREEEAHWITAARGNGYLAVEEVWRRAGTPPHLLEVLAEADAFVDIGFSRREALWEAKALRGPKPLPLFAGDMDGEGIVEPAALLPEMTLGEQVVEDYVSMRLTLRAHPVALLRHRLTPPPGQPVAQVAPPKYSPRRSTHPREADGFLKRGAVIGGPVNTYDATQLPKRGMDREQR